MMHRRLPFEQPSSMWPENVEAGSYLEIELYRPGRPEIALRQLRLEVLEPPQVWSGFLYPAIVQATQGQRPGEWATVGDSTLYQVVERNDLRRKPGIIYREPLRNMPRLLIAKRLETCPNDLALERAIGGLIIRQLHYTPL